MGGGLFLTNCCVRCDTKHPPTPPPPSSNQRYKEFDQLTSVKYDNRGGPLATVKVGIYYVDLQVVRETEKA